MSNTWVPRLWFYLRHLQFIPSQNIWKPVRQGVDHISFEITPNARYISHCLVRYSQWIVFYPLDETCVKCFPYGKGLTWIISSLVAHPNRELQLWFSWEAPVITLAAWIAPIDLSYYPPLLRFVIPQCSQELLVPQSIACIFILRPEFHSLLLFPRSRNNTNRRSILLFTFRTGAWR